MSFPCVLGMHEVGWEDGSYRNGTTPKHGVSRTNNGGTKNTGFDIVGGKSNGEVASYLFQRQGVASSFPKTVGEKEEGFGGRQWSSAERMSDQNDEDNEELEGNFQNMTLNNNEKKADTPIEEIASTAKKLWDVEDSGEEKTVMSTGILHGDQWRENAWGPSVPHMNQSEHAVSQPIMMVQRSAKPSAYNSNSSADLHGVLSPRSADGVGLSMVEYVLASSPGGQELGSPLGDGETKSNAISKNTRVSPFQEETAEDLQQSLQREQELNSPQPKQNQQVDEDGMGHGAFSRTPGSRDPSPTSSTGQQSQDALQTSQPPMSNPSPIHHKARPQMVDFRDAHPSGIALDPVSLEQFGIEQQHFAGTPMSPSEVVMVSGGSLPGSHSFSSSSLQHLIPQQQLALAVAAQQQQQQQQLGLQSQNPYYMAAGQAQEMYGNASLPQVNPGAQMVHPQYAAAAAYSIQPWGVYPGTGNVSANGSYLQQQQQQQQTQQQQQQQQQQAQLLRNANSGVSGRPMQAPNQMELIGNQQSMTGNTNYQLIAPPGAPQLGLAGTAAYYDQSGNLVLSSAQGINGVSPQQLAANPMAGALRMVSPMMLNAANNPGNPSNAAGRLGNTSGASGVRLYGQQAQQQITVSGHNSMNSYQPQNPMNGNVLGNNLGILGGSSNVGAVGSMATSNSRRDVLNNGDYSGFNKRQSIQGYYPSLGGPLTVSAQPSYNSPQELPTPPLLTQGSQSGFSVGSPISSGLSRYMQMSASPEKKYQNPLSNLNSSPFGNSVLTQGNYRGGRMKETGRSRLLEDFRNNRYPNIQLRDLANHIVEFSQDQHGSRFIQQKLERASPGEKNMVFHEILPAAYNLMTDVFGNYVIQKFFEFGSDEQKHHLASCIRGNVLPLALQMYGCRVIQKALECIPPNVQVKHELVMELEGHVLKCVKDQNGNHVVQKCIECVDPHALQFIINAFQGQVYALSTHPYGCRVIQRILEHCLLEQTMPILGEMHDQTERLVQDQYGNYVIQHVLEHGTPEDRNKIVMQLRGHILPLSQHKFASNVVEKCVSFASRSDRAILIDEVCNTSDGQHSALYTMMKDQFANYVVQKMIDVAEPVQRKLLMHRIRPHVATLRKYTYGKHILAKLEKYYMNVKPTPEFLPLTNGQLL